MASQGRPFSAFSTDGVIDGIVGPRLFIAAWIGFFLYFRWSVGWHLWERQ